MNLLVLYSKKKSRRITHKKLIMRSMSLSTVNIDTWALACLFFFVFKLDDSAQYSVTG